ncbi:hypothetical protein [Iodobacter sp.]|nr:hypothetical protein [Iodobacter sp.]
MMLKPLQEWICDSCGKTITSPDEGYVIWQHDSNQHDFDFRIIHKFVCEPPSYPSSVPLKDFLGTKGSTYLLSFISLGKIKARGQYRNYCHVLNFDEFVDLYRRVQIPYYEEARTKFNNPQLLADMEDASEVHPYQEDVLKQIIEKY